MVFNVISIFKTCYLPWETCHNIETLSKTLISWAMSPPGASIAWPSWATGGDGGCRQCDGKQGLATFCEGPDCGHSSLCPSYFPLLLWWERSHRQHVNKQVYCFPIKIYLWTQRFEFYVFPLHKILHFKILFSVKAIFSSQVAQAQMVGWPCVQRAENRAHAGVWQPGIQTRS